MTLLGIDISHHQGTVDFAKVKAAGYSFVVIKATEGTGYTDPNLATYRAQAHAAELIVGLYHYAGSSTAKVVYPAAAEAAHFAAAVGPLQAGEFAVLDYEPAVPPAGPAVWARTWLDAVAAALSVAPWIYLNGSTEQAVNWSSLSGTYGLWLAKYDGSQAMTAVSHWPALTAKQFTDKGTVPGISGPVDVDVFYGTTTQLLAYGKGGSPAPATGGLLMALTDAEQNELRDNIRTIVKELLGPDALLPPLGKGVIGWPMVRPGVDDPAAPARRTFLQFAMECWVELTQRLDLTGRPGADKDTAYGQTLSLRGDVRALAGKVTAPQVDAVAFAEALAGNEQAMQVFATALAPVLTKALGISLANG